MPPILNRWTCLRQVRRRFGLGLAVRFWESWERSLQFGKGLTPVLARYRHSLAEGPQGSFRRGLRGHSQKNDLEVADSGKVGVKGSRAASPAGFGAFALLDGAGLTHFIGFRV